MGLYIYVNELFYFIEYLYVSTIIIIFVNQLFVMLVLVLNIFILLVGM